MKARRATLEDVDREDTTHAGLWLDKYLTGQTVPVGEENSRTAESGRPPRAESRSKSRSEREDNAATAKSELLDEVARSNVPQGYKAAFERRSAMGAAPGLRRISGVARVEGRVIVGLGQKGPAEIGIALDHTWGVPVLPGSSLKGIAAAAAHELFGGTDWEKPDARHPRSALNSYDWLFGTTEDKGAVAFLDAWWVPEGSPLALDVMTPHHGAYYGGENVPPADTDSPVPVSFLTATGKFHVIIEGDGDWVEAAWEFLEAGLRTLGIGAKTNAGYGRLTLTPELTPEEKARDEARERWANLGKLPQTLKGIDNATDVFAKFMEAANDGCPADVLAEVARALFTAKPKVWKDWIKKDKRTDEQKRVFETYFKA